MHRLRLGLSFLFCFAVIGACTNRRPPTDAEIKARVEEHARHLFGNTFRSLKIEDLKRRDPIERYVDEIDRTVVTYPISYRLHIESANGPVDEVDPDVRCYWNRRKLQFIGKAAARPGK